MNYPFSNEELVRLFEELPLNVFFKDTQGRYQLTSHICNMISGGDPNFDIQGKTDLDIQPDKALGKKFLDEDLEMAKTGKDHKYIEPMVFGGQTYYYEINKKVVRSGEGKIIGILGTITDMTELITSQKELEKLSSIDSMTGCFSRSFFELHKKDFLNVKKPVGIIMADCNRLKKINDTFGHKTGDSYIQAAVLNFRRHVSQETQIIRLGGDEFAIIIPDANIMYCQILIADLKADEGDFKIKNMPLSISYGFDCIDDDTKTIDQALNLADKMMYKEKQKAHEKADNAEK